MWHDRIILLGAHNIFAGYFTRIMEKRGRPGPVAVAPEGSRPAYFTSSFPKNRLKMHDFLLWRAKNI